MDKMKEKEINKIRHEKKNSKEKTDKKIEKRKKH